MEKREGGYEQNWEKKGNIKLRMENSSKQKRKKKQMCEDVEHKEVFISFVMCRKGKN